MDDTGDNLRDDADFRGEGRWPQSCSQNVDMTVNQLLLSCDFSTVKARLRLSLFFGVTCVSSGLTVTGGTHGCQRRRQSASRPVRLTSCGPDVSICPPCVDWHLPAW